MVLAGAVRAAANDFLSIDLSTFLPSAQKPFSAGFFFEINLPFGCCRIEHGVKFVRPHRAEAVMLESRIISQLGTDLLTQHSSTLGVVV